MMKIKVLFAHTFDDLIRIPPTSSRLQYEIRHLSAKESIRWVGSGGKLISFIGSDGSGKSTLSKDIQDWINYKLTSEIVYLGQQKSSFILSFYKLIGGITKRIKMDNVSSYIANRRTLIYARFRLNNLRHAKKKVRNGVIVLADRYPLREFRKMKVPMDGPRISSHLRVSKKEIDIYERMDEYPDIMIILNVDLYTSLKRTNDLDSANEVESRAHKIDAIQNLISKGFSDKTKFKVVDATQSYELVLKEIKRYIWRNI